MTDTAAVPTFEVRPPEPPPLTKAERERRTFLTLLPELLTTHAGRYVAVHEGRVVDTDADDIALVRRVHARVGYVPIHVGLVADPQPVGRGPGLRAYQPRG